jgi:mRNA interferase MazF
LRRAEIWTVSDGAGYTGKPRPAVIIQDDHFDIGAARLVAMVARLVDGPG